MEGTDLAVQHREAVAASSDANAKGDYVTAAAEFERSQELAVALWSGEATGADDASGLPDAYENARTAAQGFAGEMGMAGLPSLADVERVDYRTASAVREAFGDDAGRMLPAVQAAIMRIARRPGGQALLDQAERLGLHTDTRMLAALADAELRGHRHHSRDDRPNGRGDSIVRTYVRALDVTASPAPTNDLAALKAEHRRLVAASSDALSKNDHLAGVEFDRQAKALAARIWG